MLYRTHHHSFLFPRISFTSSSLSFSSSPNISSSPNSLQAAQEEGMEGALKGSFRPDVAALKTHPHHQQLLLQQQAALSDELWAANNNNNGQRDILDNNEFFVDDLLDFSNALSDDPEENKPLENSDQNDSTTTPTATTTAAATKSSVTLSPKLELGSLPDSGLDVPADDLESLEWLSHFVEDSFSGYSLTCPVSKLPPEPTKVQSEPEVPVETKPSFTTPVHTKARTKRARSGGRVWSLGSPSLTESSSSSTSSSSTTTSSSSPLPCSPWLAYQTPSQSQSQTQTPPPPPAKKQKKKAVITDSSGGGVYSGGGAQQPRRCSHCGVQKTPQWRAGPLGAKTLCNACGVRFKSGRLLPEYRPACSPTFSNDLHSNNHRKVLEMRRKKELETGLTPPVQSF
ncbi:hypothetical protein ACH5RR_013694 [Cinchona calisaya]|uniref:GATA-type domain-containing protein n=1 Tax=Cinchona calisaya TaxID=153742 RepID=A0ABD3A3F1_9GENT